MNYDYTCGQCGCSTVVSRSMADGPVPSFRCACSGMMDRVWSPPQVVVRGESKQDSLKLPGINLAAYQRSPEEQERIYTSVIAGKRHRDVCEKGARGTSTRKLKDKLFRRVGSIPRELLVAESRSNDKAAGTLLKERGKDLYKKHGCWWGEK